jgi:hypothetical protein
MARKPSREELLQSLHAAQSRELALYDLVRHLVPPSGWYFVHGPRDVRASLVKVWDDGRTDTYEVASKGTEERSKLERLLYETESDGPHYDSLLEALQQWRAWRSRVSSAA